MGEHPPPQAAHWPEGAAFTVGHSTMPIERFIALLQTYGIERLGDIRDLDRRRRADQPHMMIQTSMITGDGFGTSARSISTVESRSPKLVPLPVNVVAQQLSKWAMNVQTCRRYRSRGSQRQTLARPLLMCAGGHGNPPQKDSRWLCIATGWSKCRPPISSRVCWLQFPSVLLCLQDRLLGEGAL
jgi:hypothetical protein